MHELETSAFPTLEDILRDLEQEEVCTPSGAMCPGATLIPEGWDKQGRVTDATHSSSESDTDVSSAECCSSVSVDVYKHVHVLQKHTRGNEIDG